MTFKEPLLACLGHDMEPLSRADRLARKRLREQAVFSRLLQGREDIERTFAER